MLIVFLISRQHAGAFVRACVRLRVCVCVHARVSVRDRVGENWPDILVNFGAL